MYLHMHKHMHIQTYPCPHMYLCTQLHSRFFENKYVTFVLITMRLYDSTNVPVSFLDKALFCIKMRHFISLYLLMDIGLNWDFAIRVLVYYKKKCTLNEYHDLVKVNSFLLKKKKCIFVNHI